MADRVLNVKLDSDLAEKVRSFAAATGAQVEGVVRDAVADYVNDWSETLERLAEYERTGELVDGEEALRRFEQAVASRAKPKI